MYIEQGYRGNLGRWKYFFIPAGFVGLMVVNYLTVINSTISVEEAYQQMIDAGGDMGSPIKPGQRPKH